MRLIKFTVSGILLLIILGCIGSLLMYKIGNYYAEDVNHLLDYSMCLGFTVGFLFITYIIYLGWLSVPRKSSLFQQGIYCFILENLIWILPFQFLLYGGHIDAFGIFLNALAAGLPAFFIPRLHFGLSKFFGLNSEKL